MKKYILAIIALIIVASCKTKTAVTPPISANTPIASNTEFFSKIKEKPNFQQLKINSKVNVETGSYIPTLDATIYIENGQKVWMNMLAVFLNVGRGIATPDGIRGYEKWNKTYNLTALRDPAQTVSHHLLDSLTLLPYIEHTQTMLDVGSGGGQPGIPTAICRPDLDITLLDANTKKTAFLQPIII